MITNARPNAEQRWRPLQRKTLGLALLGGTLALVCSGCSATQADLTSQSPATRSRVSTSSTPVAYTGSTVTISVPDGMTEATVQATGGGGGGGSTGAVVTGVLSVSAGQKFSVSVGGVGQNLYDSHQLAHGGWGGMGGDGGNGVATKDYLRNSAAGGGATTVQLQTGSSLTTVAIAGGGGGRSGGPADHQGGSAGVDNNDNPSLQGQSGQGSNGGAAGGASSPAGDTGQSGSGLGYHGGGGGGGLAGGDGGAGGSSASPGSGGGAGSSSFGSLQDATVGTAPSSANGSVTFTWSSP